MRRRRFQPPPSPAERHLASLLAMRPDNAWQPSERADLAMLAQRMAELDAVDATLAAEGLTQPGRVGVRPHPMLAVRRSVEISIKRYKARLRLVTTVAEAERAGRRLAQEGDAIGLLADGSYSWALCFALDPLERLARPISHDFELERVLRRRLIELGEIDAAGAIRPGGRLAAASLKRREPETEELAAGI